MNTVELLGKKRDGRPLDPQEIAWMVDGYTHARIPDYQMAAFLMAVAFAGMDAGETAALTRAMIDSGETIDLSAVPGIKVDKHSTGGVGDKVSLILAPLVACAGVPVPMMAGRGLGHTGGTLDKLESIPGFRTALSIDDFRHQLGDIGCAIAGQTDTLAPADRKMYALRDVTATVASIPLICASILSKKKAEGTDALVLDIKTGKGAFFPSAEKSLALALALVGLGNALDIRTVAMLSAMDQPLGNAVGNWLEVLECIDALRGNGPADLMDLTFALGGAMLVLGGQAKTAEEGAILLRPLLDSGQAYARFLTLVAHQGGDLQVMENPDAYPKSACTAPVESPVQGFVAGLDAMRVGLLSVALGAGRATKEDAVDPTAGIVLRKKIGDPVERGDVLAVIHTNRTEKSDGFKKDLLGAFAFSKSAVPKPNVMQAWVDEKGRVKKC